MAGGWVGSIDRAIALDLLISGAHCTIRSVVIVEFIRLFAV